MPSHPHSRRNRQTAYRARMKAAGFVQISGWVHASQEADAMEYLAALRTSAHLTTGPLRDEATRQLVSVRQVLRAHKSERTESVTVNIRT